jgi:hypothetical protein
MISMGYMITDGEGYLAGKRIYRDPKDRRKIIALWSPKKSDAMRFDLWAAADHMVTKLALPDLRVIGR